MPNLPYIVADQQARIAISILQALNLMKRCLISSTLFSQPSPGSAPPQLFLLVPSFLPTILTRYRRVRVVNNLSWTDATAASLYWGFRDLCKVAPEHLAA